MALTTLCATAVAIGAGHTILGPDHYVPFVAMARAGRWSTCRTVAVTAACGLGHVAGSVAIGLAGIAAGIALEQVEGFEGLRGGVAAWLLVVVGIASAVWGCVRLPRPRRAEERTSREDSWFTHASARVGNRPSDTATCVESRSVWAPWALFLVFLFGPCEPLIPLLMYPAATLGPFAVGAVALAFLAATVGTMLAAVLALRAGCAVVQAPRFERYGHTLAGLAVTACGLLILAGW